MTQATEDRFDITATIKSLAAEATDLKTRVVELRKSLDDLNERIRGISSALDQQLEASTHP
ncbi:hypothetical protein [Streptomyces brasiliensis]|uniref:Uncharacterized protein n=1 Tax=Streptomyces brasiliensis TaxID=1954 RepID=A0A917L1S7_9ACTN|nr:hypothetical protein [Streptomyces brasiliensis]GGJ38644.1 hypothetical protein GCM10010121_057220 [Streptomyces brasiliensis]